VKIVGHRGAAGRAPENTLASFRRAWELGAAMVEMDIRLTADGHAVLLHDATLDRTTSGSGPLAACTLAQVRALDAGSRFDPEFAGERVPTLAEALDLPPQPPSPQGNGESPFEVSPLPSQGGGAGGVGRPADRTESRRTSQGTFWLIELKAGDDPARLVERAFAAIQQAGAEARVRLISFDEAMLAEARRQAPAIPRGMIAGRRDGAVLLAAAGRQECVAVHPAMALLTPDFLAAARAAGYLVNTWTINTPDDLARVAALGPDEITTDYPDLAVTALRQAGTY
jgi:glycerophosphoryl diester phosphodiesterase